MRITVIGTGYLGAVHAACMAQLGHTVLGVDTDRAKVDMLAQGRAPFFEPELPALLTDGIRTGRLRFGTSLAEAADFADVHFVCVGTPQLPGSQAADLSYVDDAVRRLARFLRRPSLLVGKSTVPVGTAARLATLAAEVAPAGPDVDVAWNPEFLSEGFAVRETLHPDRVVVGVRTRQAHDLLREVYAPILTGGAPFIVTDLATAELVKVAANAFLATKVSFINAMAEVCEATGADVTTLAAAIGQDPRIGSRFLAAGVGFGGGCLPKDIHAFMARATQLGVGEALAFLSEVDGINLRRRSKAVETAAAMLDDCVAGRRIAVLGASFKPNTDDVRDSPALVVADALQRRGASVRVHDPQAIDNARAAVPTLDYTDDVEKALEGAQLMLHLTQWREYQDLDPVGLRELVAEPRLLDCRNALDLHRWSEAGWTVQALGRPVRPPLSFAVADSR